MAAEYKAAGPLHGIAIADSLRKNLSALLRGVPSSQANPLVWGIGLRTGSAKLAPKIKAESGVSAMVNARERLRCWRSLDGSLAARSEGLISPTMT